MPLALVQSPCAMALDSCTPFHRAMLDTYKAILCSPHFLLLEEKPGALDGYALASRLSYFLWSAPPDAALMASARSGGRRCSQPSCRRRAQ